MARTTWKSVCLPFPRVSDVPVLSGSLLFPGSNTVNLSPMLLGVRFQTHPNDSAYSVVCSPPSPRINIVPG